MAPRLLLADDSITIQRVIELTFADEPVEVVTVGDGRQAIERIQADPPDIVLADVGMPERDGYDVAEYVRAHPHLSHIPVVLLTGAFEPVDEARASEVGCAAVLTKPFEPQIVISRVRELLSAKRPAPRAALAPLPPASEGGEPRPEPVMPAPGVPAATPDDYLDRLDAALAGLAGPASRRAGPPPERDPEEAAGRASVARGGEEAPSTPVSGGVSLFDAFTSLLAAEQGHGPPLAPVQPAVAAEDLIEEVVRRVIARMGDTEMRRLVLDTAERLVREEIERIKAR